MDFWKYFSVGHTNHHFMNPMSAAKFDEIVEMLRLPSGARMLDIACGKAPLLLLAAERYDCTGVGVELSPPFMEEARANVTKAGLNERIELVEVGGADYDGAPASFDLACCVGASWIWGGHKGSLKALANWVKPGGLVLVGEPYWRCEPSDEYIAGSEFERDSLTSHRETAEAGASAGLVHLHSIVSSEDDWDRYEGYQWDATERYAHANPDDPDNEELLTKMRGYRESYLRHGRDQLGWALYLYLKS